MTTQPEFIDNRDGNTLALAIRAMLGVGTGSAEIEGVSPASAVRIATAFFSPAGFAKIADHLRPVSSVRLLLGADLAATPLDWRKKLGEPIGQFERRRVAEGLQRMDVAFRRERDSLPFTSASSASLRKLIDALRAGNMEVRRYEKSFLHAKAYIVTSSQEGAAWREGVIVGSSNLTSAGLARNLELNLACRNQPVVNEAERWFDELWNDAEIYDLANVFEEAFQRCCPWDIFIRVLWQLYGSEVSNEAETDKNLPLTNFQKHGAARALRLIRERGGVIVADEVGLGKTFIAGEILQLYKERRQRALLVCPAALRDSTWDRFLHSHQMYVECLSFEELAGDSQLQDAQSAGSGQQKLKSPLDEYQLVIVDEAHNYRNPQTPTRAATLRRLLAGQRRDLVLLTATPVNNSLWDLYHLLRFFVRQDAQLADCGILSIRARFERAMQEDPSSLNPDVLFPIIDATTVKRTRQFVKKHYSGDVIKGPDGQPRPIVFPQPKAISVRYNLDDLLPGFFDRLEQALDPDSDDAIEFARYRPGAWRLDNGDIEENARNRALIGLLRSGILKRFESSVFAFRKTVEKMVEEHGVFLDALDAGQVVNTAFMRELSADDDAVFEDLLAESAYASDAAEYDVQSLRAAVERDRHALELLANEAKKVEPNQDPKLRALADALVEIARQAEREAADSLDEAQKRKVIVFSFFEDTVEWISDFLDAELERRPEIGAYRGRMVAVSGSGDLGDVSRREAVQGFAPISMEAPRGARDRYDLMIATDVLAEGVNLQQCRHIVNFDMPWNPMRLVQRHGRIDRIGSPHNRVFLRTIFPVDRLDRLLNLERRILDKLAMAAASVGVVTPIEGAAQGSQVFSETREEIEKLIEEDSSLFERGGTVGAAQTGEEYRQTLRKALEQGAEQIKHMPWNIGSGMRRGERRGIFFCAVVGRQSEFERPYLRFIAADDAWKPGDSDGAIERELGTCLRLIECMPDTPVWYPDGLCERAHEFWELARKDILGDWMQKTDPANLQPAVRPLNHRVAAFIRSNTPEEMPEDQLNRALDILESPWSRRDEVNLRTWFTVGEHEGAELSRFLAKQILDTGLEPTVPPNPLPPIGPEDIELLCWMGIERHGETTAALP